MNKKVHFSRKKTITYSAVSIFLFCSLLEIGSYFYISNYSETGLFVNRQINNVFHPFRGWVAPENSRIKISKPFFGFQEEVFVETDRQGRVITPPHYKNPDLKIAILGGSTVFGVGSTSSATTVPALLGQELFNKFGIKAEITNLGVRGYNSFQELMTLHEFLLENQADIVIALSGSNDAKFAYDNDDIRYSLIQREVFDASVPLVRKVQKQQPVVINPEGYLRNVSYFMDFFFRGLYRLIGQPNFNKSSEIRNEQGDRSNIPNWSKISMRNYRMMRALVDSTGGEFIHAIQPSIFTWENFPGNVKYVNDNLERFTSEREYMTSFLDALSNSIGKKNVLDLRAIMDNVKSTPYVDSVHYTDFGAKKIARSLSDYLKPKIKRFIKED